MTDTRLLSAFMDAWNAGERPDVDDYLRRATEADREDLAAEIGMFLSIAQTPEFSPEALSTLFADPQVKQLESLPSELGLWPATLPRLRREARLRRDELVKRLAEALGLKQREAKVARYYHQMETGTLEPQGVSDRVINALASILGVDADELADAGRLRGFARATPRTTFGRTYGAADATPAMPASVARAAEEEEWDEVDELFRGRR